MNTDPIFSCLVAWVASKKMKLLTCFLLLVATAASGADGLVNNKPPSSFSEMKECLRLAALGESPVSTKKAIVALEQLWDGAPSYHKAKQKEGMKWWQRIREEEWEKIQEKKKGAEDSKIGPAPLHGENKEFDAIMYRENGYDPDRDLKRSIAHTRTAIAKNLLRFHLEEGDLAATAVVLEKNPEDKDEDSAEHVSDRFSIFSSIVQADLYFALGEYEKAIALYEEHLALTYEDSIHHMMSRRRQPALDDVLFSKMGLATCRLDGDDNMEQAKRYFACAMELQETHGLLPEMIVSALRIQTLCTSDQEKSTKPCPQGLYPSLPPSFEEFYPTVARLIAGKDAGDDGLGQAFQAFVHGNYVESRKLFAQAASKNEDHSNGSATEFKALLALLLRERNLDELANIFQDTPENGTFKEDPFFLLKQQVLSFEHVDLVSSMVQRKRNKGSQENLAALDAVLTLPRFLHSRGQVNTVSPFDDDHASYVHKEVETVCSALESSSTLRAAAYLQMAKHLMHAADTKKPGMGQTRDSPKPTTASVAALVEGDERDLLRQQRQRSESLALLEKALKEPGVSPMVKVQAKIDIATLERSLARPERVERTKDGIQTISIQATNEYGVTASTKDSSPSEKTEDETLLRAWSDLEEVGQSDSLTALEVARRMKKSFGGSRERQVLTALFGAKSKPILARRQQEAAEDLKSGSGERAEVLYAELLSEMSDRQLQNGSFMIDGLISAKKKQGKYKEAIAVFNEYVRQTEDFQKRTDMKGYHLQRLAILHQLDGDLDMATTVYQEMTGLKNDRFSGGSRMQAYGYVGLGDVALERNDLETAKREFQNAIELVQGDLDAAFSKDPLGDTKSNAIAGLSNCLNDVGEVYSKYGYFDEAIGFFEKYKVAVDSKWFHFRESSMKRASVMIAKTKIKKELNKQKD